jgi:PAS domain S-box-containing protein
MKDKANTKNRFSNLIDTKAKDISHSRLITTSRAWLEAADVMSKEVTTISPDETVLSAAKRMCEDNISCIIVVDNARVAGILTETDLLKGIAAGDGDFDKMPITRIMSRPVESISPDLSVLEAGKIAEAKHIKRLPVLDGDQLVGIITQTDLIRVLTSYGMWSDVVEVMNKNVVDIQSQATVAEAAKTMASCKISCIVAVEGDDVVGVFTEKDLLKKVVVPQKDPANTKIEEVMSSPVISIPPDYSLFSAAKAMEKMRIRRLVVIEDKKLCGIITQTNIFMAIKDKLQKEEEKNLGMLAESPNSIFTVDLNWKTTYVNPAFMKLLEVSDTTELVGQPFLPEKFWFDPEERNTFLRELEKGNIETAELQLRTCKGNRLWVTIFASITKNIRGQINGRQGILYDITERKRAAETMQKANEELREQARLKNEFVVTMSHELRTPLTIFKNIISNALAGVTGRLSRKLRKDLEIADETIDRLAGITNNFLDISKIEAGKMTLNSTPLVIQSVVAKVVETLKLLADNKNIDLKASMPDGELLVNADYNKIYQIMSNLIDNAVKFVPDCGGEIMVRVKDLGAAVGIDVEDNGPGIRGDDISKVFDRFVQLRKRQGPGKQGTGLGLAITKELVELHGGRIQAENIPTGGARFCITLPKCGADFENQDESGDDSACLVSTCHQHEM